MASVQPSTEWGTGQKAFPANPQLLNRGMWEAFKPMRSQGEVATWLQCLKRGKSWLLTPWALTLTPSSPYRREQGSEMVFGRWNIRWTLIWCFLRVAKFYAHQRLWNPPTFLGPESRLGGTHRTMVSSNSSLEHSVFLHKPSRLRDFNSLFGRHVWWHHGGDESHWLVITLSPVWFWLGILVAHKLLLSSHMFFLSPKYYILHTTWAPGVKVHWLILYLFSQIWGHMFWPLGWDSSWAVNWSPSGGELEQLASKDLRQNYWNTDVEWAFAEHLIWGICLSPKAVVRRWLVFLTAATQETTSLGLQSKAHVQAKCAWENVAWIS